MTANNIKKLSNDEHFEVFNIVEKESGKFEALWFNLEGTFYWNHIKDNCTYEEAVQACKDHAAPNKYPVMLDNVKINWDDVKEISKKFITFREVPTGEETSCFEQYIPETMEWKNVCSADNIFDFVSYGKSIEDNPRKIIVSYVDTSNGEGFTVAGSSLRYGNK